MNRIAQVQVAVVVAVICVTTVGDLAEEHVLQHPHTIGDVHGTRFVHITTHEVARLHQRRTGKTEQQQKEENPAKFHLYFLTLRYRASE